MGPCFTRKVKNTWKIVPKWFYTITDILGLYCVYFVCVYVIKSRHDLSVLSKLVMGFQKKCFGMGGVARVSSIHFLDFV